MKKLENLFPPAKKMGRTVMMPNGYTMILVARLKAPDSQGGEITEIPLHDVAPIPLNRTGTLLVEVFETLGRSVCRFGLCTMTRDQTDIAVHDAWSVPILRQHDCASVAFDLAVTLFGDGRSGLMPKTYRFEGSAITLLAPIHDEDELILAT